MYMFIFYRLRIQSSLISRPPQTMGQILEVSITGRKCLCVSRNVVLWSKHFDIIVLVPMFYLSSPSSSSSTSSSVRRLDCRASVVVVVRPLSVVRRPSSVERRGEPCFTARLDKAHAEPCRSAPCHNLKLGFGTLGINGCASATGDKVLWPPLTDPNTGVAAAFKYLDLDLVALPAARLRQSTCAPREIGIFIEARWRGGTSLASTAW